MDSPVEIVLTPRQRAQPSSRLRNRHFLTLDAVVLPFATGLAFALRFEGFGWPPGFVEVALWYGVLSVPLKLFIFLGSGLYRRVWRHAGTHEAEQILKALTLSGAVCFVLGVWLIPGLHLAPSRVPLSVLLLDALLTGAVVSLPRMAVRIFAVRGPNGAHRNAKRVLIAGAGDAGAMIAKELLANPQLGLVPIGFLDDDVSKHRNRILNLPVFGPLAALPKVAAIQHAAEVIIAMPRAPGAVIREVVAAATAADIKARTMPGMFEIISGRVALSALRPVEIQDLLRREQVTINLDAVRALVAGKTILVTGAGGSIGSELCRQIARQRPERIILLGHGENSIFDILNELVDGHPGVRFTPVIVDVRDRERLARVFDECEPTVVFHAAAHKHVPMMECNVPEAITNNVLGTRNVVELAAAAKVERLVLISTDKAVRPTSVMGASKRVAEQIVQLMAEASGRNFVAVRFGNVLGSRGSVVPTFLKQIAAGGPVTVTHPEMRRFFMTIPEAVQLVLQAAALGRGGEVFVLDMGKPVKVADLAADLIRLTQRQDGQDIEIRYTGARPGEKLYEEMFFSSENAVPTVHPKVLRARNADLPPGVSGAVDQLIQAAQEGSSDGILRALLGAVVPDFDPSNAGSRPTSDPREPGQTHSS